MAHLKFPSPPYMVLTNILDETEGWPASLTGANRKNEAINHNKMIIMLEGAQRVAVVSRQRRASCAIEE
jgi:hypothetical protein